MSPLLTPVRGGDAFMPADRYARVRGQVHLGHVWTTLLNVTKSFFWTNFPGEVGRRLLRRSLLKPHINVRL